MKKTMIVLSLAAFSMVSAAPAFAAAHTKAPAAKAAAKDVACKPAKKGYVMLKGKCVKKPAAKAAPKKK